MIADNKIASARRDILKTGLRAFALGIIASIAAILGLRGARSVKDTAVCVLDLPCRNCPAFKGCAEPKAEALKHETASRGKDSSWPMK